MTISRYYLSWFFILALLLSFSKAEENVKVSLKSSTEVNNTETKFGLRNYLYKAINKHRVDDGMSKNRRNRVKLSDVPYFDILNKNREYRRQIISPSQLPRQPKERWEQVEGATRRNEDGMSEALSVKKAKDKRMDDDTFQLLGSKSAASITSLETKERTKNKSMKRAKQLYYYGPEFLELLGISYLSNKPSNKDIFKPTILSKRRSIEEIPERKERGKKDNDTSDATEGNFLSSVANAAGSQIGVALASNILGHPSNLNPPIRNSNIKNKYHPNHLGGYPPYPGHGYDYDYDQDYYDDDEDGDNEKKVNDKKEPIKDKKKKRKKKKRHPNTRPSRYGQSPYAQYPSPYAPYPGAYHPSQISSGLINSYPQQFVGGRPGVGSGIAQPSTGRPGIGSGITQGAPNFGNRPGIGSGVTQGYHQTYPSTFSGSGINVSPAISTYGNSGFHAAYPSGSGVTTGTYYDFTTGTYHGSPYGRSVLVGFPEARKKGVTVGKVVGGALAAGNLEIDSVVNNDSN